VPRYHIYVKVVLPRHVNNWQNVWNVWNVSPANPVHHSHYVNVPQPIRFDVFRLYKPLTLVRRLTNSLDSLSDIPFLQPSRKQYTTGTSFYYLILISIICAHIKSHCYY